MKPDSEYQETYQEQNTSCVKKIRKSAPESNNKLEQIRKRYMRKVAAQPEGYREKLLSSLEGKYQISPKFQKELAEEWGLEDASDI